jgi:hypothetical protein
MGTKTQLSKLLRMQPITGENSSVALTHEVNRQSVVKELLVHIFLMSKFDIIDTVLTAKAAKNQYFTATGGNQSAHCAPGQIYSRSKPIQQLVNGANDLDLVVENLFGRTDDISGKFNVADSRVEENGLREGFAAACRLVAESGRHSRFNRAEDFYPQVASAFSSYRSNGLQAFSQAIIRQRALMNTPGGPTNEQRLETIEIIENYYDTLASAPDTHETVQGLYPEDLWREYRESIR